MKEKIKEKARKWRPKTLFIRQIIKDIGRTTYKELKVAMMDTDEQTSIKVIEPI